MGESKRADKANTTSATAVAEIAGTVKTKRRRFRKEGRDEHLMVAIAVFLTVMVAVAAIYQTVVWAHG